MDLTGEVVFVGLIEEIKAAKHKDVWTVWVKTRTGPLGQDYHRFKVKHEEFGQWVVDMFKREDEKT